MNMANGLGHCLKFPKTGLCLHIFVAVGQLHVVDIKLD